MLRLIAALNVRVNRIAYELFVTVEMRMMTEKPEKHDTYDKKRQD